MLLHGFESLRFQLFVIEHLCRFFVRKQTKGFLHFQLAGLAAIAAQVLEHPLQLAGHFFHARRRHDLNANRQSLNLDFDFLVVELAFAQHLAKFLPCVTVSRSTLGVLRETNAARCWRQQGVKHAFFGRVLGAMPHF